MARGAGAERGAPGGGVLPILLVTVLLVVALPLCLIVAAGMLPAGVAALIDNGKRRDLTRTVAAANLAGVVPPAIALFHLEFSVSSALSILRVPQNWLIMYGAAAIGWGLNTGMPALAAIVLELGDRQAERRLKTRAAEIAAEWGEGGAQPPR